MASKRGIYTAAFSGCMLIVVAVLISAPGHASARTRVGTHTSAIASARTLAASVRAEATAKAATAPSVPGLETPSAFAPSKWLGPRCWDPPNPPVILPETSAAIFLPVLALGLLGGAALWSRRKRAAS